MEMYAECHRKLAGYWYVFQYTPKLIDCSLILMDQVDIILELIQAGFSNADILHDLAQRGVNHLEKHFGELIGRRTLCNVLKVTFDFTNHSNCDVPLWVVGAWHFLHRGLTG